MMLSFFGDAIVAVLLIATISYAAVLNRRLAVLRSDSAKFEELIRGLTLASQRAETGLASLKAATEDGGRRLELRIAEAKTLHDDFAYMMERGGSIADRLEDSIRARRDDVRRDDGRRDEVRRDDARPEPRPEPRLDPRREIKAEAARVAPRAAAARPPQAEPRLAAKLEPRFATKPEPEAPAPRALAPSRAERDLLRVLAGR